MTNKKITLFLFVFFFVGISIIILFFIKNIGEKKNIFFSQLIPVSPLSFEEKTINESTIHLLFVGDIMLDRGVKNMVIKYGDGDWLYPFKMSIDYLSSFDGVIANLEGPVSNKGIRSGSIYSFRMSPAILPALQKVNIKAVNIANNHQWDYGRIAFEDTLELLKKNNIGFFGGGKNIYEAQTPYIFRKDTTCVAIIGATEFLQSVKATETKSGIASTEKEYLKNSIEKAKKECPLTIAIFHFGEEYHFKSVPRQQKIAHEAIDAGVDMVIGHHPHVIEENEIYKGKEIFYSLGNLIFDQSFSTSTMTAGLLEVEIQGSKIKSAFLKTGTINHRFQLEI